MRLLLAIDDSKFSEAAVQNVIAQHSPQDAQVQVLNVVDLAVPIPASYHEAFEQESLKHGQELVQRAQASLGRAGFKVETAVEEGDPRARILDHAVRWKADLIVLGARGREGVERFLMGSVSETVARHAPCSVEIVRLPSKP